MRIIIDTELQAIIVPDSYYAQVDKLNEVIEATGGRKLVYADYVRMCFEKTYATQIICASDVPRVRAAKGKPAGKKSE